MNSPAILLHTTASLLRTTILAVENRWITLKFPRCGYHAISFNSCRNRHCPKCQTGARDRWIAARQNELLPVRYIHVVFTVPHHLVHLALVNQKVFYNLLFHATAEALLEVAAEPKHLGAQIGFLAVLHSWGQNLLFHPHIHISTV